MNLSQKIAAALDARPESGALPCETSAEEGSHRLSIHLTANGPVGLAFDRLEFSTSGRSDRSPEAAGAPITRSASIGEGRSGWAGSPSTRPPAGASRHPAR